MQVTLLTLFWVLLIQLEDGKPVDLFKTNYLFIQHSLAKNDGKLHVSASFLINENTSLYGDERLVQVSKRDNSFNLFLPPKMFLLFQNVSSKEETIKFIKLHKASL